MKIIVLGCLIAQMKRFDALITTQKTPVSAKSHFGKNPEKIAQNDHFSNMTIFWRFFLIFKEMGPCRGLGFFLHCNHCIKMLHLSYQTPPYNDFHFLGFNGFLQFFRPLVAGAKHQQKKSRKLFSVFLQHKAYKITRAGNISLILREM